MCPFQIKGGNVHTLSSLHCLPSWSQTAQWPGYREQGVAHPPSIGSASHVKRQTTTGSIEGPLCTYYLQYIIYQLHNSWSPNAHYQACENTASWDHICNTRVHSYCVDCHVQVELYWVKLHTATSPTLYNLPIKGLGQGVKIMLLSSDRFGMVHDSSPWLTSPLPSLYLTRSLLSLRHTQICVSVRAHSYPPSTHTHMPANRHTQWPLTFDLTCSTH